MSDTPDLSATSLSGFHPAVSRWFGERFPCPTRPQVEGWRAIRKGRHTLIAAPTGSGKTLAAFLIALDELLREGVERGERSFGEAHLPDEVRVLYVSPLKALSADIHRNLSMPRRGIRRAAREMGLPEVRIRAAVRSGDTPSSARRAMLRTPPHILVTTPESLYLLLTAAGSREMLRSVRTVIVDEIHAVIESRRGAHLALSLERLEALAGRELQRIGLSATQRPLLEVARFLVGASGVTGGAGGVTGGASGVTGGEVDGGRPECALVDAGHLRKLDLGLELPGSPLEAVMAHEVWEEVYDRLAELAAAHRTTLVFVNTRRMAERVARHLAERLGEDRVAAHHGSLSKETRLRAERELKDGRLGALVATASLELGIDIGHVDLVCQLGSPHRISTFLQRVGRSGHTVTGTPRGRLFPLSRDDLVECAALLRAAGAGELDRVIPVERPLDVLAQQLVAEVAAREWEEDALYRLCRRAWPYRRLSRESFDQVLEMLSRGVRTRRGRRGAHLHRDAVRGRLRGRRGARLTALTCGGAIPDNADYRVLLQPEGTFLGTLNEDFAIESSSGDIFQLGNCSWRIDRVETGVVRVSDAHGKPPTIPFWLGEAPTRSDELSTAISELRHEISERLGPVGTGLRRKAAEGWLVSEVGLPPAAAFQLVHHLAETKRLLGVVPTRETLVLERFFDEAGGMQLVLHSPFGSRVNRAWGLALRKRFCRKFNFELQAAATEDGILLSLGPQHSFPLEEVFRYLRPETLREVLVQALLEAPLFQTRWRWNATIALAVRRWRGGGRTPPQIQRMEAEDFLAAIFPDAAACFENIESGEREVPDHPLVEQTIRDCLTEAMDLPALETILERILGGELELVACDTPEPSPLSHELLTARPYAFLDDAPAEERRTQAVYARRTLDPSAARELGALDPDAIERVRDEAWPDPRDADEVHDALLTAGFLTEPEAEGGRGDRSWRSWLDELAADGRAARVSVERAEGRWRLWIAAERLPELRRLLPAAKAEPALNPPSRSVAEAEGLSAEEAARELLRGRTEVLGPVPAGALGAPLGLGPEETTRALLALEAEGAVLRGAFTAEPNLLEWCDRRLLARIHRYTIQRLRAEISPVNASDFIRFLFEWQRVEPGHRTAGIEGLAAVVKQLDGYELPAAAWEPDILAARCEEYQPDLLDGLCLTGRVAWGRLSPPGDTVPGSFAGGPIRSSPVALFRREHAEAWLALSAAPGGEGLSADARAVLEALGARGASFFDELTAEAGLLPSRAERALGELAAHGRVTSDSFAGLRALLTPSDRRPPLGGPRPSRDRARRRRGRAAPYGVETAGRWSLLRPAVAEGDEGRGRADPEAVETFAFVLLRRYGVVFRRLLMREALVPAWRELALVYRRLEARGEVRGGRFVAGFAGEQFALPEAVGLLRAVRRREPAGRLISVSAADPLNLVGIVTPGERVPAVATSRIVWRDGVPVAAHEAGRTRSLVHEAADRNPPDPREVERSLVRRVPPALRWYLGRTG